jgi:hypothetical protein
VPPQDEAICLQKSVVLARLTYGKAANTLAASRYLCVHCRCFEQRRQEPTSSKQCVTGDCDLSVGGKSRRIPVAIGRMSFAGLEYLVIG